MTTPFLFVIGDSISMQYGPYLKQYLGDQALYARKGDLEKASNLDPNGRDSETVLVYMRSLIEARNFQADILMVNCGLHDIKRDLTLSNYQIPPEQYRQNLVQLINEFPLFAGKLVWVSTTPVADAIHLARNNEFKRYNADVLEYNQIAQDVMRPAGISTIDLYTFTCQLGSPEQLYEDHVHYREGVRMLQGAYIAGCLAHLL